MLFRRLEESLVLTQLLAFIATHECSLGHSCSYVMYMTYQLGGYQFHLFASMYYSKTSFTCPVFHLHEKYKQVWTASCLNWQNYHLEAGNRNQWSLWKEHNVSKPTWSPLLPQSFLKAYYPAKSQQPEMSVMWSKTSPCRLPWAMPGS